MRRLCIGTLAVVFGCAAFAAAETSPLQGGLFQVRYADADKTLAGETLGILQEALAEFARDLPAGEAGTPNIYPSFSKDSSNTLIAIH